MLLNQPPEYQVFLMTGILGTVVYLAKIAMMLMGAEDGDWDSDESFEIFTITSVACMAMGFGWVGLAMRYEVGLSSRATLIVAAIAGFVNLFMSGYLLRQVRRLATGPRRPVEPLVGMRGEVYTGIDKGGLGRVRLSNGHRFIEVSATSDRAIEAFTKIEVTDVLSQNSVRVRALI